MLESLLRVLKEFVKTRDERLVPEIVHLIREVRENESALRLMIEDTSLGASILEHLQRAIDVRWELLEEKIALLRSLQRIAASSKIVYEMAFSGQYPVTSVASVLGITARSLLRALEKLRMLRETRVPPACKVEVKRVPLPLAREYDEISKEILSRVREGGRARINSLLPRSRLARRLRSMWIAALVKLAADGRVELTEEGEVHVRQ